MGEFDVFHFDESKPKFDDYAHANGTETWYARDLMGFLGYSEYKTFSGVINRAISACATAGIDIMPNFQQVERELNGRSVADYKLTKFACYLIAMNGDPKKPQVARAQIYFVAIAETLRDYLEESENIERLLVRDEISDREKSLSGVANQRGVTQYQLFQNAGYRGMYNKNLSALKEYKGLKQGKRSLLDFMGKEELAANLFRLTQTELKIKNDDLRGQNQLEVAAERVGRQVRKAMMEISGTRPEDLALTEDLNKVRTGLKQTHRRLGTGKTGKPKDD